MPAFILTLVMALSTLLTGCVHDPHHERPGIPTSTSKWNHNTFLVGAFNLRNFGPARLDKPEAMNTLATIARRYDLLVLMEIRDKSGAAPAELLALINSDSEYQYALALSNRAGRANHKEQYGFLYRLDRINILDFYDYDDGLEPGHDLFSREPAVAYVDLAGLTLSLIVLHADPNAVALELNRLIPVYEDALLRTGDADAIILGDLNADCAYLPLKDRPFVKLLTDKRFIWLLGDDVDTTVRASTHCAYDRIIISRSLSHSVVENSARVFDFTSELNLSEPQALIVSDHFPIEVRLHASPSSF